MAQHPLRTPWKKPGGARPVLKGAKAAQLTMDNCCRCNVAPCTPAWQIILVQSPGASSCGAQGYPCNPDPTFPTQPCAPPYTPSLPNCDAVCGTCPPTLPDTSIGYWPFAPGEEANGAALQVGTDYSTNPPTPFSDHYKYFSLACQSPPPPLFYTDTLWNVACFCCYYFDGSSNRFIAQNIDWRMRCLITGPAAGTLINYDVSTADISQPGTNINFEDGTRHPSSYSYVTVAGGSTFEFRPGTAVPGNCSGGTDNAGTNKASMFVFNMHPTDFPWYP